jgi:hypothetical protein
VERPRRLTALSPERHLGPGVWRYPGLRAVIEHYGWLPAVGGAREDEAEEQGGHRSSLKPSDGLAHSGDGAVGSAPLIITGGKVWTLRLLADRLVELEAVDSVSKERSGRLSIESVKPRLHRQWVFPPKADAAFVAAMEDVPEVHHRPCDEERPLVGLDETNRQLVGKVATPIPAESPSHCWAGGRSR